MLNAFFIQRQRLDTMAVAEDGLPENALWIDVLQPTDEERAQINAAYRLPVPDPEDVDEIEDSARFFEDKNGLHLNSYFLHREDGRIGYATVAITIHRGRLFTLHDNELPSFRMFRLRARRIRNMVTDAMSVLLTLFETKVEELADVLEEVHTGLQDIGKTVLEQKDPDLAKVLDELGRQEDVNGKVRLCLMDTQRALTFLLRHSRLEREPAEQARDILRDIDSLLSHNSFLFEKVNFLMDAALGFINIDQNRIIKIFSIAAVVFLPPTLVASIYGMNFHHMPELDWNYGYPWAIILMITAGIAPYLFFKRKGWL